jgi:hypothetical protein
MNSRVGQRLGNYHLLYLLGQRDKRALVIKEQTLGRDHPSTLHSIEGYAALLRKLKRGEEAATLEERSRQIPAGSGSGCTHEI